MSDDSPKDAAEGITIRVTAAQLQQIAERLGISVPVCIALGKRRRKRQRKQRGRTRGRR